MVCGALYLLKSSFVVGFETEKKGWRRGGVEMEMVEGEEGDEEVWQRGGG